MSLIGEDCHYFITGGCTRGNQCCFRHQPAARLTENSCPEWIQGKCLNPNCGLRHIPVDRSNFKRKAATPCFYENQPNGCLNPHCQFLHTKKSKMQIGVSLELSKTTQIEASVKAPKTIPLPVATTSQVSSIETSKAAVGATLIPPPPAPVHSLPPALGTPTIVNGVLTIAPSRGILGPTPSQVQVSSVQLLPPLVTHHVAVRPKFMGENHTLGVDLSGLPKTGHFNEQVRLFKEMLSAKQKTQRNNIDNGDKHYNGSDSFTSSEEEVEERKSRGKNKKKSKKGSRDRWKKRSKGAFSKADEEFLFGDFKDVPLDKKHKKSKNDKKGHDKTDVQVKSYEQVLREKALRKMMEKKRKEKFDNDFEDILHAKVERKKSRRKRSKSDGDEDAEMENSRKESIDLNDFVFSKEDAVELAVDEDEFDNERTNDKKKPRKHKEQTEKEPGFKKTPETHEDDVAIENNEIEPEEKESTEDRGVLIIPDETTDLTFSVDDTDDLALELNQESETFKSKKRRKATAITKKVSSSVNRASRTNDVRKNNMNNSRTKKPNANRLDQKPKSKRNVLVVDSSSTVDEKKAEKFEITEGKKVISLARREDKEKDPKNELKQTADSIKIKTFEEIMAEKRKRKMQTEDIVVLSDGSSPPKKSNEILKERSEKFKSAVLITEKPVDNKNKDLGSSKKSAAQIRREKLQLAKQEYEKKRRSMQFYQVKSAQGQKVAHETTVNDTSATAFTTSDAAPVKKVKLQRQSMQKTSDTDAVSVRSFEEIMKEKKLRKQQQQQPQQQQTVVQQKRVDTKPLQSFLRRRSLSNQRNSQKEQENKTTTAESDGIVDVPVKAVTFLPVAKVIGRRRSSSPILVPQGDSKSAPVKLRRNPSNSDNKVSSISPLSDVNSSTVMEQVKDEAEEKIPSDAIVSVAVDEKVKNIMETTANQPALPESSREDIQEALDEKKRLHEQDMLSDDEFEKEINDLLSDGEDDDVDEDVNDDDFMMELEQMIDS